MRYCSNTFIRSKPVVFLPSFFSFWIFHLVYHLLHLTCWYPGEKRCFFITQNMNFLATNEENRKMKKEEKEMGFTLNIKSLLRFFFGGILDKKKILYSSSCFVLKRTIMFIKWTTGYAGKKARSYSFHTSPWLNRLSTKENDGEKYLLLDPFEIWERCSWIYCPSKAVS